jgi:hypothetical protein
MATLRADPAALACEPLCICQNLGEVLETVRVLRLLQNRDGGPGSEWLNFPLAVCAYVQQHDLRCVYVRESLRPLAEPNRLSSQEQALG